MTVAKLKATAEFVVSYATERGATDCDVAISTSTEVETGVRMGEMEKFEASNPRSMHLRVFVGKRSASTTTTNFTRTALRKMIRDTIEMARVSEPDDDAGLPAAEHFAKDLPELDLADPNYGKLTNDERLRLALATDAAAFANEKITNSRGTTFADETAIYVYANSRGFAGAYESTAYQLVSQVVAGTGTDMKVGFDYSIHRNLANLKSPQEIGDKAAERAIEQMGSRKVKTQKVPVIFDRRMAAQLLGQFVGAASGTHVYRESSFMAGLLGEKVASDLIKIVDDGHIPGAIGSRPFDKEGLPTDKRVIINDGVLACYLIDAYAGRKLGVAPNGGGVSNLYIENGETSFEEILASVENGLYLTGLAGPGFNVVNGNYSRGATGIWIKDGKLTFPVSEVTVASNILDMFKGIEMVGNDMVLDSKVSSPTIKVGEMMIGGN